MIVRERASKELLTPSKIGDYSINPYVGCPHACRYCYASYMTKFVPHTEPWGEWVDVKVGAAPIDLDKIDGKSVFLSSATDCYNPAERECGATRAILEQLVLAQCRLHITTKSALVLRDIDLLRQMSHVTVAMSINTLDESFRRDMDRADPISERLRALRELHEEGIRTGIFVSPIFIRLTDWRGIIQISRPFVDSYMFEDLNMRGRFKNDILNYIRVRHADLYPLYERIYIDEDLAPMRALEREINKYVLENNIDGAIYFH